MPIDNRLNSKRIYLRSLSLNDATDTYCGWLNNPLVNSYLETRYFVQTLNDVKKYIDDKNKSEDEWLYGIFLNENDLHIGNIKLGPVKKMHELGEVSLFIGEVNEWGKGYASEAIKLITEYGFQKLKLNKMVASMYEEVLASTKAFLKAGWKQEAVLKKHYMHEGKPMNLVVVSILKKEFST